MDEGKDTTTSNGSANQLVQFLVTANRKLQVTRGDTLDTEVFGCVTYKVGLKIETSPGKRVSPTRKFQDLSSKVFKNGRGIDSCLRTDTNVVLGPILQVTVNTANWELKIRSILVLSANPFLVH